MLVLYLLVSETKNDLAGDGYEHIVVQREIGRPDLDLLREIENVRPGGHPGDCTPCCFLPI
jgi:hypothetical protein